MSDKETKVNSWRMPAIAALMLVALVVLGLFINGEPRKPKAVTADNTRIEPPTITQTQPIADKKVIDSNTATVHKHTTQHAKKTVKATKVTKPAVSTDTTPDVPVDKPVEKNDETVSTPLDESLVMSYSTQKKSIQKAGPQPGWEIFEKYLKDKAISADGKTGIVELTFTVSNTGKLNDFKVTKGLSETADKKAIELIKDGPDWVGETNAEPKTIAVKVQFH